MIEPDQPAATSEHTAGSNGGDIDPAHVTSLGSTVWGTVTRLTAPLAAAHLFLAAAVLLVVRVLAAPSIAVRDGELRLAPVQQWPPLMWLSAVALLLLAAWFIAWACAYPMIVAGGLALGREVGLGTAAIRGLRAAPRLFGFAVPLLVGCALAAMVAHWVLVAVVAAYVLLHVHPLLPIRVFVRSSRWHVGTAVTIARGQMPGAFLAAGLLGLAWYESTQHVSSFPQPFGGAGGLVGWALVSSVLVAISGAALAWALLRHLKWPAVAEVGEAAAWLTEITEPSSRSARWRAGAVAAASLAVAVGAAAGLSATPVTTAAALDTVGRAPSWTARLPGWTYWSGPGGIDALVSGGRVVVGVNRSDPPGVVVYDRRGRLKWTYAYQGESPQGLRFWVTEDAVVLHSDSHEEFRILDLSTGETRAVIEGQPGYLEPLVTPRALVVSGAGSESDCGQPRAYDLRTGKLRWKRPDRCLLEPRDIAPTKKPGDIWMVSQAQLHTPVMTPATRTSVVWSSTANSGRGEAADWHAAALDVETGDDLAPPYRLDLGGHGYTKISDDLYLQYARHEWTGSSCEHGPPGRETVAARDLRTGELRWTAEVGQWHLANLDVEWCVDSSMQPTSEGLLTATPDHGYQILDLGTGNPRLRRQGSPPPAVLSGRTLITGSVPGSTGDVESSSSYVAVDTRTGKRLWTARCQGANLVAASKRFMCLHSDSVGDGGPAQRVWVRDLRSGKLLWVTPGVPAWIGDRGPRLVHGGDDWLMTVEDSQDWDQETPPLVRMYG